MNEVLEKTEVLSQDGLLDKVKELEKELAETKKQEDQWYKSYLEIKNKLETFKNAVKSVIVLVD